MIHAEAIKCRFCREFLEDERGLPVSHHSEAVRPKRPLRRPVEPEPADDETAAAEMLEVSPSLWALIGVFLKAVCLWIVAILLIVCPIGKLLIDRAGATEYIAHQVDVWTGWAGLMLIAAVVMWVSYRAVQLKRIRYEISRDRIEFARGIFSRHIDNLDVYRIIDIKLHRSLLDCLTGVGSVTLVTRDETDPTFAFQKVKNPKALYDVIKKASLVADRKQGVVHLE